MTLTSRSFSKGSSKHENPVWITGADALMDSLKVHGVKVIFGYPGGAILPIYDALHKAEQDGWLKHYMVRHEQGGSHAADGYARSTGEVGVCFGTSGPGATNLVTGIATAQMDSVPLVVVTGQVPRPAIGTDAFQETDIFGITLPIVNIEKASELPEKVKLYPQEKWQWGWNNSSEVWNGRVAMIVFLILFIELISGSGPLHKLGIL